MCQWPLWTKVDTDVTVQVSIRLRIRPPERFWKTGKILMPESSLVELDCAAVFLKSPPGRSDWLLVLIVFLLQFNMAYCLTGKIPNEDRFL